MRTGVPIEPPFAPHYFILMVIFLKNKEITLDQQWFSCIKNCETEPYHTTKTTIKNILLLP